MPINIAIDGPAGAGKSTLARAVAKRLGYIYVDTGALYRAAALFVLERGTDIYNSAAVSALVPMMDIELKYVGGEQRVYLCGENVSGVIRSPEVSKAASVVSAVVAVRQFLFDLQQDIAETNNVVMDGRDIGTVVLPNAQVKIFLTASPEERAQRRYRELRDKGMDIDYKVVLEEVNQRDYNDSHREVAPLKPAADSLIVDTTGLSLADSEELLYKTITDRLAEN
ncbi:MAG: (d)CMP kinase [Ruminococcaceae bacterium]|nr:(d)CMP kinase [Oscillospiraceae bacterium]